MRLFRVIALILSLTAGLTLRAQLYQSEYQCDSTQEYGLGFTIEAGKLFPLQNINLQYEFQFKAGNDHPQAMLVFEVIDETGSKYWQSYPLAGFASDTTEWSTASLDMNIPYDYIGSGKIVTYVWNNKRENLWFENAKLDFKPFTEPNYQPAITLDSPLETGFFPVVEYINAQGDTVNDPSVADIRIESNGSNIKTEARFKENIKLLRLALVMPLPEGDLTVYRKNQHIDSTDLQLSYYLDREGFMIKNDTIALSTYHNTGISSLQLDTEHRTACFNIDYWRDHPLLHYPLRTDTSDVFEDISYREVHKGETLKGEIRVFNSATEDLPRIMPVWDGYQSAFIFTEHADWTDLRTHRAVLFGNENITTPEEAVGGFCYFNVPVTKSVFYWNPDHVTNEKTSDGRFPGLHATIKTDKEFHKLLKALRNNGFEICLHTPEQYTTVPSEFPQAMRFMKRNFRTKSWIDHGYNNGPENNREDLVCDGLLPDSPQYALDLWRKNGVRYLWNAYYEENRMDDLLFDGHFVQPYDGFGDALPNRQITTLPNGDKDFVLWSTPSTLEVNEDYVWYYFFDNKRLQRIADNHNVFITHVYPAWTDPWRACWEYNDNGTAVAMPGFNFALSQLAQFRDEKKILLTTVEQYLGYYEKLLNVDYHILDSQTIELTNHGETIEGFTLLCSHPIVVEGKTIDFRKVEEGYLIWFNLKKNESVNITIKE